MNRIGSQIILNRREEDRVKSLIKRANYLEKRINSATVDLSYDKQELGALRWAISVIQELQNEQV